MSAVPFIQFRVLIPVIVSLDYNPPDLRYRNLLNKPESDLVEGLVKTFSTSLLDITECFLITNRFETSKDAWPARSHPHPPSGTCNRHEVKSNDASKGRDEQQGLDIVYKINIHFVRITSTKQKVAINQMVMIWSYAHQRSWKMWWRLPEFATATKQFKSTKDYKVFEEYIHAHQLGYYCEPIHTCNIRVTRINTNVQKCAWDDRKYRNR